MDAVHTAESPRFDHLVHWVGDVDDAVRSYRAAGLPAHANPAESGFRNGGWRPDERYLEIATITDEDAVRSHFFADALEVLRPHRDAVGGAGALTFAVDVTDALATAQRLRRDGHDVREFHAAFEQHDVSFVEVFVPSAPTWAPFFITYTPSRERILERAGGHDALERGLHDLTGIVVETADPAASARLLGGLVGLPATEDRVELPGATVRFEPGDREVITAVTLTGAHPSETVIDGLAMRFGG